MPVYYPRAVAVLTFILDNPADEKVAPFLPQGWADGLPAALQAGADLVEQFSNGLAGALNAFLGLSGPATHTVAVIPDRLRVEKNGYDEADSIDLEIDQANFPFDPRVARAIRIEAFLGNVGGVNDPLPLTSATRIFSGYADKGDWDISENSSLSLKGRDQTALLIDTPWSGAKVEWSGTLTEAARMVLDSSPVSRPMGVELRGVNVEPSPGGERSDAAGSEASMAVKNDKTLWGVLNDLAGMVGLVVWVEDNTVVFAPGQTVTGSVDAPEMIYGENLENIKISRKVGFGKAPVIQCVSYDALARTKIVAQWPQELPPAQTGDGQAKSENVLQYHLNGITSVAELERAAKAIYTRRERQDISLALSTIEMRDLGGQFDLVRLRAGDPVRIWFSEAERDFLVNRPMDERLRYLRSKGFADQAALAIARSYDWISPLYQVVNATHEMDRTQGYKLSVDAASYLTV